EEPEPLYRLLPFSHPEFNEYLSKVKLASDGILPESNPLDEEEKQRETYWENYHWHNSKKLLSTNTARKPPVQKAQKTGKGNQSMDRREKREAGRARKYEQVYLNQMYQYAASL